MEERRRALHDVLRALAQVLPLPALPPTQLLPPMHLIAALERASEAPHDIPRVVAQLPDHALHPRLAHDVVDVDGRARVVRVHEVVPEARAVVRVRHLVVLVVAVVEVVVEDVRVPLHRLGVSGAEA